MTPSTVKKRTEHFRNVRSVLSLRHTDQARLTALLVERRIERGMNWLAQNAPTPGWWRNCFNPSGQCRVNMAYPEDSVVTLAFEYERRFIDKFGYVRDSVVLKHYFGQRWQSCGRYYGFVSGWMGVDAPFRRHYPHIIITDELLTTEWKRRIMNPPGQWVIQYRHAPMLDPKSSLLRNSARAKKRRVRSLFGFRA